MRHPTRSTCWNGAILFLGVACLAPTRAAAQPPPQAQGLAAAARAQAVAARSRAEAMAIAPEFAAARVRASEAVRADIAGARQAATAAAGSAIEAADRAIELGRSLVNPPALVELANAMSVAHSALAAAERADSAVEEARRAHYGAGVQITRDPDIAALAEASRKEAEAHLLQALLHDVQASDWDRRVAELRGGLPPLSLDLSLRVRAANQQVEARRALAAFHAGRVALPTLPALPRTTGVFRVKAPVVLNINYNLRRRPGEFEVVDGVPTGKFDLTIVETRSSAAPLPRITLTFTFRHLRSGNLTIPRVARIRLTPDTNSEYHIGAPETQTIARDFIRALNEIDRTISAANPIDPKDVTVTIQRDDGTVIDTLSGSMTIQPALVNVRDY